MAILLVLAVIAILAGTIGPLVFRQIMKATENETLEEMLAISHSVQEYFNDNGAFPNNTADIKRVYLDVGFEDGVFVDP